MTYEFFADTQCVIQELIDQASAQGGGKVTLLPGRHVSGTIYLKSNVELHIPAGATLAGSLNLEDYPDFYHDKCTATDSYSP